MHIFLHWLPGRDSGVSKRISQSIFMGICLCMLAMPVSAMRMVASGADTAGFSYDNSAENDQPVITYTRSHAMLANTDEPFTIRVYGNGKVIVHYPVYMKRAGDYEMQLAPDELDALISALASDGVLDFDHDKVSKRMREKRKKQAASARQGDAILFTVSDAEYSTIDVRLEEYRRDQAARKQKKFNKRFRWRNIDYAEKLYGYDEALVRARNGVNRLRQISQDDRLKRKGHANGQANGQGQSKQAAYPGGAGQ